MDRRQFLKLAGAAIPGAGASRLLASDAGSALAGGLADVAQQSTLRPNYGPSPAPGTSPAPVTRKLLYINLDPLVPNHGGGRLHSYFHWNNPDWLVENHIRDLNHASFGNANYVVAEKIDITDFARFPAKTDGYRYDENSYIAAWRTRWTTMDFYEPDRLDYHSLLNEFRIIERVRDGQIDEVWHMGPPYDGNWEAVMAGPGASNSNAPPIGGTDHAGRRFVLMAYNLERTLSEMLHSYGHRAEGHLSHALRNVPERDNLWRRFLRREHVTPGISEVGNVHFPPNAVRDYDYSNPGAVQCNADDWYHYPYLTGERFRAMSSSEWSSNGRLYFLWWFRHMPHLAGDCDGIAHNWWRYIADPNTY